MDPEQIFARFQQLEQYVGWTDADADRIHAVAHLLEPYFAELVDDFYDQILRTPEAARVLTGEEAQIERLKSTLTHWLRDLHSRAYDARQVYIRWRAGHRHVELGLQQVYTNVAMARLRSGLHRAVERVWADTPPPGGLSELLATLVALNKRLDLDLALIEDAYQTEYGARRERSERLVAIGQVAGGIAHELRNPLNVIKTSVYYLLNARSPSKEKQSEHLQRIEKQVGLADGVITALSNFARMPLPHFKAFALEPWLHETIELTNLASTIELGVDCPPDLPLVLADAEQLRIVVANLLRNAQDAMPQGGRMTLTARRSDDRVELRVSDTGSGIHPEVLPRIMEPLYTTKARGIGLGLAIARAIIDKNEASIQVESELHRGTTFTLCLQTEPTLAEARITCSDHKVSEA